MKYVFGVFICLFLGIAHAEDRVGKIEGVVYWLGSPKQVPVSIHNNVFKQVVITDKDGFYEIKVPPGTYFVTAPGPWLSEPWRRFEVDVKAGKTQIVDFWFW